jgi:hypothetical protein
VKFRLVYDGPLSSEQRGTAAAKHAIRKQLHPQLKALWAQDPLLAHMSKRNARDLEVPMLDVLANDYTRCGYRFVPLVREAAYTACRLDILVLMRDEPFRVFTGGGRDAGDLDNRIKTLLDGLRMPRQCSELAGEVPGEGEDPFFCLLDDDKVVYEFNVRSDRLLAPPRPRQLVREVVAIIGVHVTNDLGAEVPHGRGTFDRLRPPP